MTDDMRDEVPVPHYEDRLWRTLARVHAEQRGAGTPAPAPGPAVPPGLPGLPAVVDVRVGRRGRRMLLAGAASIAAAAGVLAAIVVTDADRPPDAETRDGAPERDTPETALSGRITAAAEDASASSIVHIMEDYQGEDDGMPIGDAEAWVDEQTGARRDLRYDSEGQPLFDTGRAVAPAVDDTGPPPLPPDAVPIDPSLPQERIRQVDHCFGEYEEYDQAAMPGQSEAEFIGEQLAEGSLVEDGTEVVDGRELIRLVEVPMELGPRRGEGARRPPGTQTTTTVAVPDPDDLDPSTFEYIEHIYLVDAETYRPARVIGFPGEAPDYSDALYIQTIEYLPRTPENMASLSPPVPDGFELVPNLRGDGARADACGW